MCADTSDLTNQQKAQIVLDDKDADGSRWFVLLMEMSFRTGLHPTAVLTCIESMAKGGVDEHV